MEDYYKPITTIAYAIYALPKQCSQEEIKGIINFVEESFFITLPDKIKSHFTNEIFTHEYISFFSSKVVNSSNYNDEQKLILTLKEVIDYLEVSRIDVKKSISSSHSLNQLESAIRNNNLLAYSIRGLLEVCNVKYEQKEEQGKKDLLLCSQANHFPSMMLLSNYERKHNNLLESCYWLELAYRLFPYFFTSNMINMKNKLEQEVNFQESNLMKKVINDEEYHHFMFKKNVDGLENLVLNKEMIKAVYSSFYPISQLEKINDKYDGKYYHH